MIGYLDSSALVKVFLKEPGAPEVQQLMDEAHTIGTVAISRAEIVAALHKAMRVGITSGDEALAARHRFRTEWPYYFRLPVSDLLIERACDLAWTYGLRGYDSIQLAAALMWQEALDTPVFMATFDVRLWETASRVGLEAYPPDLPRLIESWKAQ
jgi:predicted nucleic acid-binding protein